MTYINRYIALSCVAASIFATSCVNEFEEEQAPVSGEGYYISLTGDINECGVESRAHWDINSNDQSLAFTWDASDNKMKSFVWSNSAFVNFTDEKKYSATTVTPNAENKKKAQLQITTGLSQEYAEGDFIWAVSPLEDSNISADNKVTFTLPDQFVQTTLNSTEHLKDYVLMSGTGTVGSDNSASISFNVLPAIYRFKITNNESEDLTVNEVSISGPFCNKAVLEYGKEPEYSVSNGTYAIKVTTPDGGLTVAANTKAYLYALVFPTNTSTISSDITLSFKGSYGNISANYTKTAVCSSIYNFDLKSNRYYDMEVPVDKKAGVDTEKSEIILYDNKCFIEDWGSFFTMSNLYLSYLEEGDVLTVYFNDCTSGSIISIKDGNWGEINKIYIIPTTEDIEQGFITYTFTSADIEIINRQAKPSLLIHGDGGFTITKVTLKTLIKEDYRDPISPNALMLIDFDNNSPEGGETGGGIHEYPTNENGNKYLRLAQQLPQTNNDMLVPGCTNQGIGTVQNIENYVIKFDLMIEQGTVGASQANLQFVFPNNNYLWAGNILPETTEGKWITISYNISNTGNMPFNGYINGIQGWNVPAGICIDNYRLEPKE